MTMARTLERQAGCAPDTAKRRALCILQQALTALGTWSEHRRAIAQLHTLSDLQLKDVGISRSEIEPMVRGAANHPHWRNVA
jgi:uncharacterized protein YjiS (DUF1127 family)